MLALMNSDGLKMVVNAVSNGLAYLTAVVVAFVVCPLLVHGLGNDQYGVWLLVDSVLAYLALTDLGVGAAVLRYVARFDALHDEEALNCVFNTSLSIFACAGLIVFAATTCLASLPARPLGVPPEVAADARWLLILLGINLGVGLPLNTFKMALLGLAQYPLVNLIRVSVLLLRNGLFIGAILPRCRPERDWRRDRRQRSGRRPIHHFGRAP